MNVAGGDLNWAATLNDSQFHQSLRRMEGDVNQTTSSIQNQGDQIEGWAKKAATAAAGYFSLQAASGFISQLVEIRSQFQQLDIAFTTMLKSKVSANQLMKELVVFAAETPFGLKDAAGAAKQLLAYGSTAKTVVGELRMLGDVASGVSVPIGDLVYLYGTLKTQGRAYAMDIRQFAGRGIPIYAELAKVLKVGKDEVAGLVEAGKVGFPEVEQAFKNMTAAGGMFGGLMEAQSKAWAGQIERFKDGWDVMLNEIAKSHEGLFSSALGAATSLVESYQKIIDIVTVSVAAYGVYRTALMATAAFETVSEASKIGLAISVNQESVARIANANAMVVEMQTEVKSLAIKKSSALQSAMNAVASLEEAQANLTNASSSALVSAQNKSSIAGKAALAAQSAFYTAKLNLETASKAGSTEAELAKMRAEVSSLAAKRASTLQTYQSTIANVKNIESKVAQSAAEKVTAAQEKVAVTRKAAMAAQSEFSTAKTNLETTAKVANSAATVELTAVETMNAAGKRILTQVQAAYNAVLAASPALAFTAIVSALGIAIYSLTQVMDAAEKAQEVLNEAHEEGGKTADSEKRKIDQLIDVINDHTASLEQKEAAYDKLKESTGTVLNSYSLEDIALGKATVKLDDYIKKIREASAARKAYAEYNELADKLDELSDKRKGLKAVDNWTRVGRSLKNTFTPTSQGISFGDWANELIDGNAASKRIVDQEKNVLQTAMDELKKEFGNKFKEMISGVSDTAGSSTETAFSKLFGAKNIKRDFDNLLKLAPNKSALEKVKASTQDALDALAPGDKDIDSYKAKLKKVDDALKQYTISGASKAENEEFNSLKRKSEMLQKIYELNDKYNNKSLTDDEKKLADIRSEYKALQHDIDTYNKNPKNKKINPDLKPAMERAIENQQYLSENEKVKVELDRQKQLYVDYEAYKINLGKDAADVRFKNDNTVYNASLDENRKKYVSYLAYLEAERAKLLNKDPSQMSGPELDRLHDYDKRINEEVKAEQKKYDDLVQQLVNYEQERRILVEKYNRGMADLAVAGTDEEKSQLTKLHKEKLNSLDDGHIKELDSYKVLYEGIDRLSDVSARKVISNARTMLAEQLASGKISKELAKELEKLIADSEDSLAQRLPDRLINIANQIDSIASSVGGVDSAFGKVLGTLGNVLGQVGNIKKGMEDFTKAGKKGDMLGQLTAGLGMVGAGISVFKTLTSFFDRSQQREEQASYARDLQNKQAESLNKVLERQISLLNDAYGTDRVDKYSEAIKTAASNEAKYRDQLKGRILLTGDKEVDELINKLNNGQDLGQGSFNKGVARQLRENGTVLPQDIDALRVLLQEGKLDQGTAVIVQNLISANEAAINLGKNLTNENVGSSLGQIADDFIATLTDGTQDFGKSFEDTIRTSILNGFKGKLIQEQLQAFYTQFANLSKDGSLSEEDISALRTSYTKAAEKAKKDIEDLEKATGIKLSGDDKAPEALKPNTLTASLNQPTGERLEGLWRGQFDITKQMNISTMELLNIAKSNFDMAVKIQENTFRTANNTDTLSSKLDQIITNTKPVKTTRD